MRVLTDEQLNEWIEANVVADSEVYWPTETIRAFESHVLETYDDQGLIIDPTEASTS